MKSVVCVLKLSFYRAKLLKDGAGSIASCRLEDSTLYRWPKGYVSLSSYELSGTISSSLGDNGQYEWLPFGSLAVSDGWSMTAGRWVGLEWWEEHWELLGLSWMAVVSCSVCSLVSISNAVPPIKPQWTGLVLAWEERAEGWRLNMQHTAKNDSATSRRRGPMMMGGLWAGSILAKPKAPTRVMLIPASMRHSPQAQHRAGDGWLCGRRDRFFFTAAGCGSCSEHSILPVQSGHFLSTSFSRSRQRKGVGQTVMINECSREGME